jgi:hypothetical protein
MWPLLKMFHLSLLLPRLLPVLLHLLLVRSTRRVHNPKHRLIHCNCNQTRFCVEWNPSRLHHCLLATLGSFIVVLVKRKHENENTAMINSSAMLYNKNEGGKAVHLETGILLRKADTRKKTSVNTECAEFFTWNVPRKAAHPIHISFARAR